MFLSKSSGPVSLVHVPGEGLRVTATANYHAPRIVNALRAGAEYRLDITVRSADGPMQLQPRRIPNHGWVNDFPFDEASTEISFGWSADAGAGLNLGSSQAGSSSWTYYIEEMSLFRTSEPPIIDEDFEFEPMFFDFEDGQQGWFPRAAAAPLVHMTGDGADGTAGFARQPHRG